MDVRPLIHLWLNKPKVCGNGDYSTANMKPSVFHGDLATTSNGIVRKVWGNDYNMFDIWLDIDRAISKMDKLLHDMFLAYIKASLTHRGTNWENWPQPYILLRDFFAVIAYDILQKGKE